MGGIADIQALVGNGATTAPKWVNIDPSISITDGDANNAPKVNVNILGQSGTAKSITKATTGVYGVTKLTSTVTLNTSEETFAVTPKGVIDAINRLDVSAIGVAAATGNRYICDILQTNGKISATLATATIGSIYIPIWIDGGALKQITENSVLTNLASTTAVSTYAASPRPGVTGILGAANGGTGNNTYVANRLIYSETENKLNSTSNISTDGNSIHFLKDDGNYVLISNKYNDVSYTLLRDHHNGNISLSASSGSLHLGYSNTTGLYLYAGKDSNNYFKRSIFAVVGNNDTSTTPTNQVIVYGSGGSLSQPVYVDTYGKVQSITGALSNNITGNANTATAFASDATISLTGDITGFANGTHGWSIDTTIGAEKVTNEMLKGFIENEKLKNSKIIIADIDVPLGGSISLSQLGLSSALRFKGVTTTVMVDGRTTADVVINDSSYSPIQGDVVLYEDGEYVWTGNTWEELGRENSFKIKQTEIVKPANVSNQWISSIGQNANGDINVSYTTLDTTGVWSGNAATATAANITSTDNAIVRFDGTDGKFQNSQVWIDDNGGITSNSAITVGAGYFIIKPFSSTYDTTGTHDGIKFYFNHDRENYNPDTLITYYSLQATNFYGALKGNANTATKWATAQKVYVTLGTADTTTTIQGGSSSAQTIGVDGILGTANGGTGNNSYTSSRLVYTNTDTQFATGTLASDGNNITLSADYSISKPGKSVSWYQGRDYALIRITSTNGYTPLASIKTTNGSWDIGHYTASGYQDKLLFSHITDTTYSATSESTDFNKKSGWIEMLKDGSMMIGKADIYRDNTAFKNTLILENNRDQESSYATLTETKPSFGIGFNFRWQDGTAGTLAGIYGVGLSSWRAGLAFRIKKTAGTTSAPGSHDQTVAWMTGDGLTIKGKTIINPSYSTLTNSFNEGLRINRGANGWAGVYMGGVVDTTSGTGLGVWAIGTHSTPADATTVAADITDSQLYISYNGSSSATSRIQGHNANGFSIRPRLTVNTDVNTSYNFYVNGTSYFNGNTTHNGIDYFANGTTYYINNSGTGNLNALTVNNTTASTTTGTGGLIVKGGAGIAGRATASEFNATRPMIVNAGKVYSNISGSNVILPAKTAMLFADGIAIANPGLTAANDVGWLRVTGTAETDMVLELATGDDGGGGETIHVRQYNTSNTIVNDLTLLDNQGNTLIPNSLRVSKGISKTEAQNKIHIVSPGGGSYATSTSKITGALKIQLPVSWTSCMLNFNVDIYDYATSRLVTYHIGGYNYSSSSQWVNTAAYSNGTGNKSNLTVRFGHDGTHCCVIIGETDTSWSYPQINVRDVYLAYSNQTISNWETGWVISFITTLPTITGTTITSPNRVLDGTENRLAYYSAARTISQTGSNLYTDGSNLYATGGHDFITAGNEFNFISDGFTHSNGIWFNYETVTRKNNGNVVAYIFGNGKHGELARITSGQFSGNAATATKFSSNATVTLTGDTTGTSAGSTKSWSVPTVTSAFTVKGGRVATADSAHAAADYSKMYLRIATDSMTTNKPKFSIEGEAAAVHDGHILEFHWDNSGAYNEQLALSNSKPAISVRAQPNGTWSAWTPVLTSINTKWVAWGAGTTAGPTAKLNIGGTTITSAAIPYASTSASGIVTTGEQSFTGKKTFNWLRVVNNSSNNADDALFYIEKKTSNDWAQKILLDTFNYGLYIQGTGTSLLKVGTNNNFTVNSTTAAFGQQANPMTITMHGRLIIDRTDITYTAGDEGEQGQSIPLINIQYKNTGSGVYNKNILNAIKTTETGGTVDAATIALTSGGGNLVLAAGEHMNGLLTKNGPFKYGSETLILSSDQNVEMMTGCHNSNGTYTARTRVGSLGIQIYLPYAGFNRSVQPSATVERGMFLYSANIITETPTVTSDENQFVAGTYYHIDKTTGNRIYYAATMYNTNNTFKSLSLRMPYDKTSSYLTWTDGYVDNSIIPWSNNSYTLGSSDYKWKEVHATTFYGTLSGTATTANNLKTTLMTNASTQIFVLGATGTSASTSQAVYKAYRTSTAAVYFRGDTGVLMGAAWNDYAEYRQAKNNIEIEPGRVVKEVGDETLELATSRLQRGCSIVSNTFGISIGESKTNKLPLAVAGRVLAYPLESLEEFKECIGWPVCSGPNGTVSIMTEEEERDYPSRIIGTIASVPDYEIWHGGADVEVNGRVWIKVR